MKGRKRWVVRGSLLVVLILAGGLEIARSPQRQPAAFSLIDAVSAATRSGISVVGLISSDYERLDQPAPRDVDISEAQVEGMVRYAVSLAGGLNQRLAPDAEWVVIKPNIVELKTRESAVVTDWRVVKALVKIVHEVVPQARVTIAEGGAWVPPERAAQLGDFDSQVGDGFAIAGFRQLLQDPELEGIDLDIVDLNFDETAEVEVPDGGYVFPKYHLPLTVLECDFLITVPVLKVIGGVGMTNALKNFVGIAPGLIYGWPKMRGYPGSGVPGLPHNPGILDEVIVDLVAAAEADFAVVDAILGMERAKTDEDEGRPVRLNTIIASPDLVAADAVSARLIGFNPDDLEYLTLATYKGLGQSDLDNIKIKGSAIDQVAVRFEKYPAGNRFYGEHGHYGQGCRTWLLKGPFDQRQAQAGQEFIDLRHPGARPGQEGWSPAVYFHDDKIDLDKYYDDPFDCVVYAYAECTVPQAQEAELWVGSDEDLRLWLNGEQVYDYQGRRPHQLPNDRERISLRAGQNTLLVRAGQTRSRFDFSLNICAVETDPRYDGNRVWGLKFSVPAGETPAAGPVDELAFADEESDQIPADARVLAGIRMERQRDSLTGALLACLRFVGEEISPVQLSGLTGRAFQLCVADSLDREAIARSELSSMAGLFANLGYRSRVISAPGDAPDFAARQQEAWEAIRASIDRQIPVVAHTGWSYGLIDGYHPRKERYYAIRSRGRQSPIAIDELGADDRSGGLNLLLLEERQPIDPRAAEQRSLRFAVAEARRQDEPGSPLHRGFSGFEYWIAATEQGAIADDHALAFTIAEIQENRAAASAYLRQLAAHYPAAVAALLRQAGECYDREGEYLDQLAKRLPYRRSSAVDLQDPGARKELGDLLRQAYAWERPAIDALEQSLTLLPSAESESDR